jgi:hypothetical protein
MMPVYYLFNYLKCLNWELFNAAFMIIIRLGASYTDKTKTIYTPQCANLIST